MKLFTLFTIIVVILLKPTITNLVREERVKLQLSPTAPKQINAALSSRTRPVVEPKEEVKEVAYVPSSEVEALICQLWGNECKVAVAVAKAESGLRCDAHGDKSLSPSSFGVFQIRAFPTRPPVEELTDCEKNIRYAFEMWKAQGWAPWSAFTNGAYLKHL